MTDEEKLRKLYVLWQLEEKYGIPEISQKLKDEYKNAVLAFVLKPYHWYHDKLIQYETVILN